MLLPNYVVMTHGSIYFCNSGIHKNLHRAPFMLFRRFFFLVTFGGTHSFFVLTTSRNLSSLRYLFLFIFIANRTTDLYNFCGAPANQTYLSKSSLFQMNTNLLTSCFSGMNRARNPQMTPKPNPEAIDTGPMKIS